MNIRTFYSNTYIRSILFVLAGIFLGWLIFHNPHEGKFHQETGTEERKNTIWTCAMHPQIRMDHPGKCPICGMDLIPLEPGTSTIDSGAVVMTEEALKLAEVQTSIVTREKPVKNVRLFGKIQADERLIQTQPAHIPGRIEKLLVNFTGEEVKKGQIIAHIYSPELVTAQKELLEALKMKDLQPQILDAVREKLRQWKLTDQQITEIEKSDSIKPVFDVTATVSGYVINKLVNVGDYVSAGAPLFEVADLSHVWASFDAYESDLPWIKAGDRISFSLTSRPGKEYSGTVSYIDPVINPLTRVARVRIEVDNPGHFLKPEMFITGIAESTLSTYENNLIIPQSAVLWTGTRSLVYVKIPGTEEPSFKMREIILGPELNENYVVLKGLNEGDEIVTNGTFVIDAAAQLSGKPSMMNTDGGKLSTGHNHTGMETHGGHTSDAGKSIHKQTKLTQKSTDIALGFKNQLTAVYRNYLAMKNAFVESDPKAIAKTAEETKSSLEKVDMNLLTGNAHMQWMDLEGSLTESIKKIINSGDIGGQRSAFAEFGKVLYQTIQHFGLNNETVYYQFCPMAFEGKGAYWLSESEKISNPYFGKKMLTCGETREILSY